MEQIKEKMTHYWGQRTESFSQLRKKELAAGIHNRWLAEFDKYLPQGKALRILDIGTGTGFFAFLLGAMGHHVVGIDLTEEMILEARKQAQALGMDAEFFVMDAEEPEFAPESFDVLVTRNLTWALPDLPKAYGNWAGLLKKDGILINFDADYCHEKVRQQLPANHAHKDIPSDLTREYEQMKAMLRPTQQLRPQWDVELLQQAGFRGICVDTDVWQRIYCDYDEFYNPTPIFTLAARK